jgi:hypothetical protein
MEPKYITFEQAKWLKEKGFDIPCLKYYYGMESLQDINKVLNHNESIFNTCYSAPEQHQVVEWLRVNHGIWITPIPRLNSWIFSIVEVKTSNHDSLIDIDFYGSNAYLISKGIPTIMMSPQESYSAAFDIIRNNNLILT